MRELMDSGELEYVQNGNRRLIADAAIWDSGEKGSKSPRTKGGLWNVFCIQYFAKEMVKEYAGTKNKATSAAAEDITTKRPYLKGTNILKKIDEQFQKNQTGNKENQRIRLYAASA